MLPIGAVWQTFLENPLINLMVLLTVLSFGSYGVAILAFTVLTRVVTFPLTLRTLRAARGLQEMQPDMEAIQKRYKDPKRRSEEQMKLYRRK
ncbi:MAG: YidC/Oxa1 family membrane protein insertase, partial [Chloroflexi bacterium]|nr:YidC/Oxa1 family membrane protein insertase [Chloroflexota bacterium]